MKIIEKWGTGIPRLFEACEEYGLPRPKLIDFDGDFRVNMYRRVAGDFGIRRNGSNWRGGYSDVSKVTDKVTDRVTDRVTDKEQEIIFLLLEDAGYTMPQLAEKLNISRKTVAARLKVLKEKGIIERVGSDRKGYWKIMF